MTATMQRPIPHNVEGRPLYKFRCNIGQCVAVNKLGEAMMYDQGQRIETPTHLTKRFGQEKFTRLSDSDPVDEGRLFVAEMDAKALEDLNKDDTNEYRHHTPEAPPSPFDEDRESGIAATYKSMSIDDLTKIARDEEIPLGTAKTKKDIINKIMDHNNLAAPQNQ
jgi:hypothetical protein